MAFTHHRFSSPQTDDACSDKGEKNTDGTSEMRKPQWLKVPLPGGKNFAEVDEILEKVHLFTVCRAARCPNRSECWGAKTAAFLIMGHVCTRACRFCHVATGMPLPLDSDEPFRVAQAVKAMGLKYAVITSVDRDDLPDGGASHFSAVISAIRDASPTTLVEVLTPDFFGRHDLMDLVLSSHPVVVGHNLETVERLTPSVRDRRATYRRSLEVLAHVAKSGKVGVKSSLMLGLGETEAEILSAMDDLRSSGVSILTLGQYLQPSPYHLKVQRFVPPSEFDALKKIALEKGFEFVASGPLVRSSYRAGEVILPPVQGDS